MNLPTYKLANDRFTEADFNPWKLDRCFFLMSLFFFMSSILLCLEFLFCLFAFLFKQKTFNLKDQMISLFFLWLVAFSYFNLFLCYFSINEKNRCTICMDDFQVDDNVRSLPCRHLFHTPQCIDEWFFFNKYLYTR